MFVLYAGAKLYESMSGISFTGSPLKTGFGIPSEVQSLPLTPKDSTEYICSRGLDKNTDPTGKRYWNVFRKFLNNS